MWRLATLLLLPQLLAFQLQAQGTLAEKALQFLNEREVLMLSSENTITLSPCKTLLLDCWLSEVEDRNERGGFGLRFKPVDDQNIYLLYRYELKAANANTEIGFSVNYFNVFSIKYAQKFALKRL